MNILFHIGHPAQFHFVKGTVNLLQKNNHKVLISYRSKDVLENLLSTTNFKSINIENIRIKHTTKFGLIRMGINALLKFGKIFHNFKPDIYIGLDPIAARYCKLYKIPYIFLAEDDYSIIKKICDLLFPYADTILAPTVCDYSIAEEKKIGYYGYMKLAYLHPNRFVPDINLITEYIPKRSFVLLRLVSLTAHHDDGIKGINSEILDKIIKQIESNNYDYVISSEKPLNKKYESHLLKSPVDLIHHVLSTASLVVCDSQSMAVEAAMLGTPSIRFNDFAGKISVLEELEHKYHLTFGINTKHPEKMFSTLNQLLNDKDLTQEFSARRQKMLNDKIDVTAFLVWFIENYPNSKTIMKQNPEYQLRFK